MSDVIINKTMIVRRCVLRAREERQAAGDAFRQDHSRQDAAVMNVVRACEATIDLANHVIRQRQLGVPNSSGDAFRLLEQAGLIPAELSDRLIRMAGFRNVAVHAYQALDLDIVVRVIDQGLDDLLQACNNLRSA